MTESTNGAICARCAKALIYAAMAASMLIIIPTPLRAAPSSDSDPLGKGVGGYYVAYITNQTYFRTDVDTQTEASNIVNNLTFSGTSSDLHFNQTGTDWVTWTSHSSSSNKAKAKVLSTGGDGSQNVYKLDGSSVAKSGGNITLNDMTSMPYPHVVIDHGNTGVLTGLMKVWTGTDADGNGINGDELNNKTVRLGYVDSTNSGKWTDSTENSADKLTVQFHLYAFKYYAGAVAIPEPGTYILLGSMLMITAVARTKRKKVTAPRA